MKYFIAKYVLKHVDIVDLTNNGDVLYLQYKRGILGQIPVGKLSRATEIPDLGIKPRFFVYLIITTIFFLSFL